MLLGRKNRVCDNVSERNILRNLREENGKEREQNRAGVVAHVARVHSSVSSHCVPSAAACIAL